MKTTYSVVVFGAPEVRIARVHSELETAREAANLAKSFGTCSAARVYECCSRRLARSADISEVRDGERVVYDA
jgi:hypothetical protein